MTLAERTGPDATGPFEVFDPRCSVRLVFEHLTGRWAVLLLYTLHGGTYRFGELRRRLQGVSEKVLTQTLQTLGSDGLVRRERTEGGLCVYYSLTPRGAEAAQHIMELVNWIERSAPFTAQAVEGDHGGSPSSREDDARTAGAPAASGHRAQPLHDLAEMLLEPYGRTADEARQVPGLDE